jgi:hypothetical protein
VADDAGFHEEGYEPPRVSDLGSLADLTAGSGHGTRDFPHDDSTGKT